MSKPAPTETSTLRPPRGVEEILTVFGDIYEYIRLDGTLDPRWTTEHLARFMLPFPLQLSWDHTRSVSQFTCHLKLVEKFSAIFEQIRRSGLPEKLTSFGGCFAFRPQRTSAKLSTHCWGIAIDLNPETNQQGTAGDMDASVIEIFRTAGFAWGGDWQGLRKDPMHFQFCSGY